jgi:predicted TPR repeat methyltransferase
VFDAGCGTGLCAPLLRPFARTLVGVDLSPGMLAKARGRGGYDDLAEGELVAYQRGPPAQFDVVASGDTLCYFGELRDAVVAARSALRAGGWLALTLERADDIGAYRINPHGRYSHAPRYVEATLASAGFTRIDLSQAVLRREAGAPVAGLVVRAQAA